jgi:hypothetical protein
VATQRSHDSHYVDGADDDDDDQNGGADQDSIADGASETATGEGGFGESLDGPEDEREDAEVDVTIEDDDDDDDDDTMDGEDSSH